MPTEQAPTGWPPGLLQDDSRALSKALAGKPDAMRHAREAAAAIPMHTPKEELAALTLELQRRGVIDVKFAWRPGAVEGLPASECMKGAADFIAEYLALQEPTLASRAEAAEITRLRAEVEALREVLRFARDEVEDWAGYASDFFRAKHDLAGTLARLDAAMKEPTP